LRRDYLFEPPSVLNVKGKGEMTCYRMIGHADVLSNAGKNSLHLPPAQDAAPTAA